MSGFDPRKYHGRRLDEILRSVNASTRSALEEAHAAYQLCLRQKDLPTHRKGHVRMRLWQVEKQLGLHSWYFSQAGQDRYLNEQVFSNKRDGTFVEIGGYDGWTGSNCVFFEKVLGWTGLVVEASPRLVKRIGETRSAKVIHAAVSDRITVLTIENNRPGRESYEDIMDPLGYRQVAVLGVDEIWVRRSASVFLETAERAGRFVDDRPAAPTGSSTPHRTSRQGRMMLERTLSQRLAAASSA